MFYNKFRFSINALINFSSISNIPGVTFYTVPLLNRAAKQSCEPTKSTNVLIWKNSYMFAGAAGFQTDTDV